MQTEILNTDTLGRELEGGRAIQRTHTEFQQAITVQNKRVRADVLKVCKEEAALAGEDFFYSWTVKGKGGRKTTVSGLSIGGALSAARNWGNNALPCKHEETATHYIFTATFIDFETGFNMQRIYMQRKEPNIGMADKDRAADIVFQIGQSKAIRNVCMNALPIWLTNPMLEAAKEEIIKDIKEQGISVAREKALDYFDKHDIGLDRVEKVIDRKADKWDAEKLAVIRGMITSHLKGIETAEALFPPVGEDAAVGTNKKTEDLKDKLPEFGGQQGQEMKENLEAIKKIKQVFVTLNGNLDNFEIELDSMGWGRAEDMALITNKKTWKKIFAHFNPLVEKIKKDFNEAGDEQ